MAEPLKRSHRLLLIALVAVAILCGAILWELDEIRRAIG